MTPEQIIIKVIEASFKQKTPTPADPKLWKSAFCSVLGPILHVEYDNLMGETFIADMYPQPFQVQR